MATNPLEITDIVRHASLAIERAAARRVAPLGLTYRQMTVLIAALDHPSSSQAELISVTMIDRTTISIIVDRLAQLGLLEQGVNKMNRRAMRVSCTSEGKRKATAGRKVLAEFGAHIHELLGAQGAARLQESLGMLMRRLEAEATNGGEDASETVEPRRRGRSSGKRRTAALTRVRARAEV